MTRAKLQALEATANLAQITYNRDLKQLKAQTISQATLDSDRANLKNAQAQVDQQKAAVAKKTLRAPFAGHLGIRQVDLGQYLNAGTAGGDAAGAGPDLSGLLPAAAGAGGDPRRPAGDRARGHVSRSRRFAGKIVAINPQVDANSRNVQVRAQIGNPKHAAAAGHVRHAGYRLRREARVRDAAADGDRLQSVWQHRVPGRRCRQEIERAADLRHHRRDARRPGGRADRG